MGMLAEWQGLETPLLPEMKWVMWSYKAGEAQNKALRKEGERDARAARAHERAAAGGGYGHRVVPPSGANSACAAGARATWLQTARSSANVSCDLCG